MGFMMVRDQILGVSRSKPVPIIERVSCLFSRLASLDVAHSQVINSVDGSMPALAQIIIDTVRPTHAWLTLDRLGHVP